MRTTLQCRRFIPSRLTRGCHCAIASLLAVSLALPPIAFAGLQVEVEPPNPATQFRYPPGNVYVLSVGIDHYQSPKVNGYASASDARRVSETFKTSFTNLSAATVLLANTDATKANIREALQKFALNSTSKDLFVLSFSGWGFVKTKNGREESYLAPYDTIMPSTCDSEDCVDESSLISGTLLNSWMTQVHALRQIILLDTGQSDRLLPALENHWRNESCSVGPEASKRLLIVTNHENAMASMPTKTDPEGYGYLTFAFLKQLQMLPQKSAFRLQQALYALKDVETPVVPSMEGLKEAMAIDHSVNVRAELLGGDFLIDGPTTGVKQADLLRDSGLGALCYSDPNGTSRGFVDEGKKPANDPATQSNKPTNYALIIASDHYKNWKPLSNPISDATTIESDLSTIYGFKVEHLWDPTRDQLKQKLDEYHHKTFRKGDQLFIFIAGHGDYDETNDIGYLVFPDTPLGHIYDSEMNLQELRSRVGTIPIDHTFLVMDSCFAGSLDPSLGGSGRGDYDPIPLEKLRLRTAEKKTRYFLTSGGKEYVPDGRPGNHSPFAALFILALEKGAKTTGYLNIAQMTPYFQRLMTVPRAGNLGGNEEGADFFFVPVDTPQTPGQ